MFSGIVEGLCLVTAIERSSASATLTIDLADLAAEAAVGDSVAVNGVCLTVTGGEGSERTFDVITETLERTTLGAVETGQRVNIELSLRLGDRIGGHLVSGHVDAVGTIIEKEAEAGQTRLAVEVPERLARLMIEKGSVTLDGVSLTLTAVGRKRLEVALIPHTLAVTTLGRKGVGEGLNVEVDPMGRWVEKLLAPWIADESPSDRGL